VEPYREPWRPQFHFTPAKNWMNDPNQVSHAKPDPDLFLAAADRLGVPIGDSVVVGDRDAVPLLTAAQARFPQDFWLNLELGHALWLAHRPDEALGYFRAALALRPQSSVTYCGLGSALSRMGRVDEAIDYYQQAIRLDPNYTVAHINLATALGITPGTRRDWAQAAEGYARALKRGTLCGELRNDVGTALAQAVSLRKGFHFPEARVLLEQARQRLGPAGPDDLRRRVDQGRADLDLAEHLDAARFLGATPVEGKFDRAGAEPLYDVLRMPHHVRATFDQPLAQGGQVPAPDPPRQPRLP
jgi:tetratricopeptide (TPR) repeat protein